MRGCLDQKTLIALAAGALPADATAAAEAHIETCKRCAKALAGLKVGDELIAEIRDLEQSRARINSALSGLTEVEKRVSTTLFGRESF
jgi:anti-sigma factor RsiW